MLIDIQKIKHDTIICNSFAGSGENEYACVSFELEGIGEFSADIHNRNNKFIVEHCSYIGNLIEYKIQRIVNEEQYEELTQILLKSEDVQDALKELEWI